jgi:hypothetical protein
MPTLSRYFVRSALVCLGIGFTLGGLILSAKGGFVDARMWRWLPMHIILLMDGWLIQLSLGMAYWILPRVQAHDRGRPHWAWSGFVVLQIGLTLTVLTALGVWMPAFDALLVPALLLQCTGVILFAIHAWPRMRPVIVRRAESSGSGR